MPITPVIQPIDDFVLLGFQRRFQQVFNCKCAFINENDQTKIIERVFGRGNQITYPYAYFTFTSISINKESYSGRSMAMRGIPISVSDDQYMTARIIPTNFDLDVTFITNRFTSIEQGSVLAFARRWLMAYQMDYMAYSVDYGLPQAGIRCTLGEQVTLPKRENITDQESRYEVTTTVTIHGYTSEPITGTMGKVNTINVMDGGVNVTSPTQSNTPAGTVVSSVFNAFPERK